jgi:hypothetical protein
MEEPEPLPAAADVPPAKETAERAADRREPTIDEAPPPTREPTVAAVAVETLAPEPEPERAAAPAPVSVAPAFSEPEPTLERPEAVVASASEEPPAADAPTTDEAGSVQQSRQRLLLAADVALAQGRLTSPPESNAYTFYQRILELDPGSPEATAGLNAVRQALVNRTLAQLAANALDDARASLAAAAQAGVNPQLVADLSGEVENRQRQSDARASP